MLGIGLGVARRSRGGILIPDVAVSGFLLSPTVALLGGTVLGGAAFTGPTLSPTVTLIDGTVTAVSLLNGSENDGTTLFSNSSIAQANMKTSGFWAPVNGSWGSNVTDPAGGTAASPMIENSSTSSHFSVQSNIGLTGSVLSTDFVTASIYAKMVGSRRYLIIRCTDGADSNGFVSCFDLQTGAATGNNASVGNGTWDSATVGAGANSFFKCSVRGHLSSSSKSSATIWWAMASSPGTNPGANYAGDGSSGITLWRPKLVLS